MKTKIILAISIVIAGFLIFALVFGNDILTTQVMFVLTFAAIGVGGYFLLKLIQRSD